MNLSTDELSETASAEMDAQIVKEEYQDYIIQQMHHLYRKVMEEFYQGGLPVYNPLIFNKLSERQFIEWIVNNNSDVGKLFS